MAKTDLVLVHAAIDVERGLFESLDAYARSRGMSHEQAIRAILSTFLLKWERNDP